MWQRAQPVPFSHEHHVSGLGIDCRYCHTTGRDVGICGDAVDQDVHDVSFADLDECGDSCAGAASWRDNQPIRWTRVHDLPDFVQFNHSIHVAKGVGCATCHGRVDRMPLMWKSASLQMEWCLECHRNPEKNLRPRDQVFNMAYEPPRNQDAAGRELALKYHVQKYQ